MNPLLAGIGQSPSMCIILAVIAVIASWPDIRANVRRWRDEWRILDRYDNYGGGPEL